MLHDVLEWQRAALGAWVGVLGLGAGTPLEGLLHPSRELLARTLAAGEASGRALADAARADARFPLEAETVGATPFARLVRLRRPGRPPSRRHLLLAPHSGYATAVLSPLAALLAADGEVTVTEWVDARLVPAAEGAFGLEGQIDLGLAAARASQGPFHLVALSQSGPAALAVAARLFAGGGGPRPRSLALLGCQLDPTRGSSPLQRALAGWPPEALAAQFTTVVRRGYPGAGRRVYPAMLQLLAYSLVSPALYAEVQGGLWRELFAGEEAGIYARQHADLHSLADVPAELFLDALAWMQGQGPWAGPRPVVAGVAIDPAPFRGLPVLTLESAEDELVGAGQTHGIAERLGLRASRAATLAGARHHDLFTGPGFLARTGPLLRRFHAAAGG